MSVLPKELAEQLQKLFASKKGDRQFTISNVTLHGGAPFPLEEMESLIRAEVTKIIHEALDEMAK